MKEWFKENVISWTPEKGLFTEKKTDGLTKEEEREIKKQKKLERDRQRSLDVTLGKTSGENKVKSHREVIEEAIRDAPNKEVSEIHKVSMVQDDIENHIFRANFNNVKFEYFEL